METIYLTSLGVRALFCAFAAPMRMVRSQNLLIILLLSLSFFSSICCAAPVKSPLPTPISPPSTSIRDEMLMVYGAFKELNQFILEEQAFLQPENSEKISTLLKTLNVEFGRVEEQGHGRKEDPGFAATLQVLSEMLRDATNRFNEGRKEYALWRLKTAANHCVTCHTRYEVPINFSTQTPELSKLSVAARGEFFLATRQFEKAGEAFLQAALNPVEGTTRLDALRKWLIIYTRVHPDPNRAIRDLQAFARKVKLNEHERDVLGEWLASLNRWRQESRHAVDPLAKAENLIRQGLSMNDPLSGRQGVVELLRASAMLHKALEQGLAAPERRKALYFLGLTYTKLPLFFVNELPELFLEQCIREFPGSDEAKRSYKLYREIVTLGYTGSSGTNLPEDVLAIFQELHDIAYNVPHVSDRV
jgi:hypothetical protein